MPTPLVFVLAICQGSLRLLPCRIDCLRGTFIASKCRRRLRTFSTAKRWMDLLVKLPNHSQVSTPRSVALEQLPSPGASSLEGVIWYTDLPEVSTSQRGLVHCGRHPNNSMPMTGVPIGMYPRARSSDFGRCPWFLLAPGDAGRFPTEFAT
jgi:hypothetical protein